MRPSTHRFRAQVVFGILVALAITSVSACVASDNVASGSSPVTPASTTSHTPQPSLPRTKPPAPPVLVAAGDIACSPFDDRFNASMGQGQNCRQRATSDLIGALHPAAVMPLGDTQYEHGAYPAFMRSYALTWGRFLSITHPVIGDHEYVTPHAAGYFGYFGRAAGDPNKGYYSYNLGSWHVVALNNSGCAEIGGCGAGSAEERWLKADLAANRTRCTLAAWHEPRFSSGKEESVAAAAPMWDDLYAAGVEISLAGNDHDYERFMPLDAAGRPDSNRGVQEFVVGTGGVGLRGFKRIATGSVVRQSTSFGVLALTLRANSYDWKFVAVGGGFHDSGHGTCH